MFAILYKFSNHYQEIMIKAIEAYFPGKYYLNLFDDM